MNSTQMNVVKSLIENKKYDVITEFAHITYPDKGDIVVNEYAGTGVRVYKDNKGRTRVLCPKDIDTVQEGHVAQAIANGTIFDDADEVDRNASMIERTSIPYDAMINSGKDTPKHLKPMIAIVIGKMDDDGSFEVSDADRTNGVNFIKDLCDKDKNGKVTDVVDNYIEKDNQAFYSPEMGRDITSLDNEVNDIVDTKYEDTVTDNDEVDSYDDFDMEEIESDENLEPETEDDEESEEGESDDGDDDDSDDDDNTDDDDTEDSEPDTVEECGDTEVVDETDVPTETQSELSAPVPMSAQTKAALNAQNHGVIKEECNPTATQPPHPTLEGFLTKKPKKLKPIGRDVVAYITVEMNDIHSANDQAMLAGYTCSKIELVDFYITVLDTQDARYIVPHNRQYLVQMKNDLEKLLAQILRIRPINRSEQIWRVNYPTE